MSTNKMDHVEYLFANYDRKFSPDSYGYNGPGWYFWDETEAYCHGPYKSAKEANEKLVEYCKTL